MISGIIHDTNLEKYENWKTDSHDYADGKSKTWLIDQAQIIDLE